MKIRMYCLVGPYKFGFGITPMNAFDNAVKAGLDRKLRDKCVMYMMPEGINSLEVNDFGGVQWTFPEGSPETMRELRPEQLYFDAEKEAWTPTKVENKPKEGTDQTVFIKIEGYVNIRAPQGEAVDIVNDMSMDDLAFALYEDGDYDVTVKAKKSA